MTSAMGSASDALGGTSFVEIYTELRERISLLVYPPGTALSENALAEEFGVSRTPIRKVLQRLEFDGLVTARHGVGTIVEPIDMMYLRQVYALRLKLIDLIAELSSAYGSDEDAEVLEDLVAGVRELRGRRDPRGLARLYLRYNEALTRAIGNEPLREITDRFFYQTSRVWVQLLPEMDWREEVDAIVDEIDGVLAALRAHDMQRVSAIRRDHFVRCLHRINRNLSGADVTTVPSAKGG